MKSDDLSENQTDQATAPEPEKRGDPIQSLVPATSTPSVREVDMLGRLALTLSKSGLKTANRSVEQIVAIGLMGRELGIPLLASLQGINLIKGQPSMSANLIGALLARGGVVWICLEFTDKRAAVRFRRRGWAEIESAFTIEEAKTAGLLGKDNWRNYPSDMLWARAFTRGARKIGPDLLAGFGGYTPDELGVDEHDEEFTPANPSPSPRKVESRTVPPTSDNSHATCTSSSTSASKDEASAAMPDNIEEIPEHLLGRIDNMLAMNQQLESPLLKSTVQQCVERLREYRKEGNTWSEVEIIMEAKIETISEALQQQVEGAMDAE